MKATISNTGAASLLALAFSIAAILAVVLLQHNWDQQSQASPTAVQTKQSKQAEKPKDIELPTGGRTVFPEHRLIALYGHPDNLNLGVIGHQPLAATLERVKQLAAEYQPHSSEKILPTLEIITTVAAAEATDNGDYSRETDIKLIREWVMAAKAAGVYVVLDLQPGHTNFLTQAKMYEELLREPHVGLALDPEWRLAAGQMHMRDIGSVNIAEVNHTATWLADLTATHKLPQKVFLLHQFRLDMIPDRAGLDVSRKELAYVVQMDGHGTQGQKQDTWNTLLQGAPPELLFGWKNFYEYDAPMLSPAETMTVTPKPWFVSYQ